MQDTLHEGGHGLYRLNLPDHDDARIPSQSLDEAAALTYEVYFGRMPEFSTTLHKILSEPEFLGKKAPSSKDIAAKMLHIELDPIRANCDPVRYPLDVLQRYHVAKALINDGADPACLPELWQRAAEETTGLSPLSDKFGCLQDIHWFSGQIGYFPNYLMGQLIAAQLFTTMQKDVPNLRSSAQRGDFSAVNGWMTRNVFSKGFVCDSFKLVEEATGHPLTDKSFRVMLQVRYSCKSKDIRKNIYGRNKSDLPKSFLPV